jgi:outer membrane protein assembly factor BamB
MTKVQSTNGQSRGPAPGWSLGIRHSLVLGHWTMVILLGELLHAKAVARDWPQWRGPNRDGIARGLNPPPQWPEHLKEVFRLEVGEGHAAPVVEEGKLYQFSRERNDEVIRCLDAGSGDELWKHSYSAPYQVDPVAAGHGPGPKATPTVLEGNVYTQGMSSQLYCLNAGTGKIVWRHDLLKEYQADGPQYGTAASLLVEGELVIAQVGDRKQGFVVAFDKQTGKERWKTPSDGPSYCSPTAADLAGTRQVLSFSRNEFLGLAANDGRILWRLPYRTAYEQNIVTPVVWKDRVILAGTGKPTQAFTLEQHGEAFKPKEVWHNGDLRMYMSSPVISGDHLYGHSQNGKLVCLDLQTGQTKWAQGELGEYASTIVAGDKILCLDNTAHFYVIAADPKEFRLIAKVRVSDSPTWAHLAVTPERIYVKDKTRLIAYEMPR